MRPWIPPEEFLATRPRSLQGAALLLTDQAGRVLLMHDAPAAHPDAAPPIWAVPGGHLDAGENPWQAAVRELAEETGLRLDPCDGPSWLGCNFQPARPGTPMVTTYFFDGGTLAPRQAAGIRLSEEHDAYAFRTMRQWSRVIGPASAACYRALLGARESNRPVLLERGRPLAAAPPAPGR